MQINGKIKEQNTYDAIVVGSGISGGWAAKELTEKGLKVIMLERGRMIEHVKDYTTAFDDPWTQPHRGRVPQDVMENYPVQSRTGYTINESSLHLWVNDKENPYTEVKRFDWIRGYHVGGRSLMWGRHCYRLSDLDFEANARDGIAVDWPIRYKDIEPWYDYVERFAGIQGMKEGLPQVPDGQFLPPIPLNCVEQHLRERVAENFGGRVVTIGRTANLTQPHNGRGACQYRNRCMYGCPYGAYFSTQAATLPAAEATGNLTLRPHSIVNSIIYDEENDKAVGVRVIDAETNEWHEFYARIIFLNASCLGSTFIMLNSKSNRFPNGFANSSGELGHNLMDHHFRTGARGETDDFADVYDYGRRPTGFYVPRFRNVDKNSKRQEYIRGFGYQGGAKRTGWQQGMGKEGFGADFKEEIIKPGPWSIGMTAFGECLPYHENYVNLDEEKRDKWGQPTLKIDCEFKDNEKAMRPDMANSAAEMLEAAGFKNVETYDAGSWPGLGIHEMGTARMGRDPKTSVLNQWNQCWDAPNVFITDGACMTSSACQNPSITYMALTARAADYALQEMKRGNI